MKKFLIIILTFSSLFCACQFLTEPGGLELSYDLADVQGVQAADTVGFGSPLTIQIQGELPDSQWRFHHFELYETPASHRGPGTLVIQPIIQRQQAEEVYGETEIEFEQSLYYAPQSPGALYLKIEGKTTTWQDTVIIQ